MRPLALGIGLTVLLVAGALYFATGAPNSAHSSAKVEPSGAKTSSNKSATGGNKIASVDHLVVGLEERMQLTPDDGKGWLLLAKSYRHLGRMDDAREAYRKADALSNGDTEITAQLFGLSAGTANAVMEEQLQDMETSQ